MPFGVRVLCASCASCTCVHACVRAYVRACVYRSERTFWSTTGLYPQEFILSLGTQASINLISMSTHNVRAIRVEKTENKQPQGFEELFHMELEAADGLQTLEHKTSGAVAKHLRFVILSGYDDFVAVHKVYVSGDPLK